MVDFEAVWLDLSMNIATGSQPVHLLERPLLHGTDPKQAGMLVAEVARTGRYWVPQDDVFRQDPRWTVTSTGQYARVPVNAYSSPQSALAAIWGIGLKVGLAAHASFSHHVRGERPEKIVLVLGNDCVDLRTVGQAGGFRCFLGLAVVTPDQ